MPLKPVTTLATAAKTFDLPRVSRLQITQEGYGQPLVCHAQIDFARQLQDGSYEDAPAGTPGSGVVVSAQLAINTLQTQFPDVYAAMFVINTFAAMLGVQQGVLQEAP